MAERIVVTATGILSALGMGMAAHLDALVNNRDGLSHPRLLSTVHANELMIGEVALSNDALSLMLGLPIGDNGYTRTTLLALVAIQQLLSEVDRSLFDDERFAFVNANTVGGMCSVEDMYMDFIGHQEDGYFVKYIDTLDCAESTQNVANYFKLKPFMATLSTACSSSANALILGARMIQQGIVDRAICGGCDAMSRFTVNGFLSLKNVSKTACKPFDQNRMGLNLGEGAGYLLLEKENDAIARGATILAVFSGYSNTNDAYHPTAPSPDGAGAYRTMVAALEKAKLQPSAINYINAHGTATANNDAAEAIAIEKLFGATPPPYSSTKPFTGHTLAAAGSIEAIFSILALNNQVAFSNLNFSEPMTEVHIVPNAEVLKNISIQHVLSNSFGFGGNNVSLIFSKA